MADTESATSTTETGNLSAAAFTAGGTPRDQVSLPPDVFDGIVNMPVMHHAVKAYLANQRQGNASTKTRGLVIGGNQKPWKQKGTGRARQGSTRAPHFVGGGTVFGPTPRDYSQRVPKQVKALARRSALNARARENAIFVIDAFNYEAPRTHQILALLDSMGVARQKVLILTDGVRPNVYLSGRNLQSVHVMPYSDTSTYHILWSDVVLIEGGAIGHALAPVPEVERANAKKAPRIAKAPVRKAVAKKTAASPAAAGKKTGAKKAGAKKAGTKKAGAKKAGTKKAGTKKAGAKKPAARKSAAKSAARKAASTRTAARKPAAKKKKGK